MQNNINMFTKKHILSTLQLFRYKSWIKNLIVFFPIFFAGELFDIKKIKLTAFTFALLCLISSSGYILNDIIDINKDRLHPIKKNRPIASGAICINKALIMSLVLFILSVSLSYLISVKLSLILILYLLNTILYSIFFKNIAYIDILFIAIAFEIRLFSGGFCANIYISRWLMIITFLTALTLASGKRIEELTKYNNINIRGSLKYYNKKLLIAELFVFSSLSISMFFTYLTKKNIFNPYLFAISFFLVANYLYNTLKNHLGDPTEFILKNRLNLVMLIIWAILFFKEIYL